MNAPSRDATEAYGDPSAHGGPNDKDAADGRESEPLTGRKKLIAIKKVIESLDRDNPNYWTKSGKPDCNVLSATLKVMVLTHERDEVWDAMQSATDAFDEGEDAPITETAPEPKPDHIARGEPWNGNWAVIDSLARRASREHFPMGLDGPKVTLRADKPTAIPREIAVKFLCDTAYKVFNQYGEPVLSLPDQEITIAGRSTSMDLKADEVVAKLGELSLECLLVRVNRLPGGEEFGEDSRREAVENFYIDTRRAMKRATPDNAGDETFADLPDKRTTELLDGV